MTTIETNWDEIPAEYRFTAVDKDGGLYAYKNKPVIEGGVWLAEGWSYIRQGLHDKNWRESLRERPSVTILDHGVTVAAPENFKKLIEHNLIFQDKNWDEVGRLEWADGTLEFSGNATESAKLFMEELQRQFHDVIEREIERRAKEAEND